MKIAYVSFMQGTEGGGSAIVAENLARLFAASGEDVLFISSQPEPGLTVRNENGQRRYSFRPQNLYWVGNKDRQLLPVKMVWQLCDLWNFHVYTVVRNIFLKERPDVVHIHKLRGLSPSLFSAAQSVGCSRVIHTMHDHELISPEGTLHGIMGDLTLRNAWPIRLYQAARRIHTKSVHHVTAPSHYLLQTVTERGFFPAAEQKVIPNSHGLAANELASIRHQLLAKVRDGKGTGSSIGAQANKRPLRILYLGRLDSGKGVEFLCDSFADAWQLNSAMQLDVVGSGPVVAQLKEYHSHPAIHFHGALYGEEKADALAKCDIVAIPSNCAENAPLTLLEAYAYGKPVLASEIGGIPEIVKDGKTGFLLAPNSTSDWVESLTALAENPEKLEQMSLSCFNYAKNFTTETVTDAYRKLYYTRPYARPYTSTAT